jgi:hypothetical protein
MLTLIQNLFYLKNLDKDIGNVPKIFKYYNHFELNQCQNIS